MFFLIQCFIYRWYLFPVNSGNGNASGPIHLIKDEKMPLSVGYCYCFDYSFPINFMNCPSSTTTMSFLSFLLVKVKKVIYVFLYVPRNDEKVYIFIHLFSFLYSLLSLRVKKISHNMLLLYMSIYGQFSN